MITLSAMASLPVAHSHPFLLCNREQFPELRTRSEQDPWKTMAIEAIQIANGRIQNDSPGALSDYIGAVALAYIVDPDNAEIYATKVKTAIISDLEQIEFNPDKAHIGTVGPLASAFNCIIALDIVYDDLSKADRSACEAVIERKINLISRKGSWPMARMGTFHTWEIYHGLRNQPDDAYYNQLMRQMTDDGVSTVSPAYARARVGSSDDRLQKTAYLDVLEFTGIDQRYYDNPKLRKFYRWFFGACISPSGEYGIFGDQQPGWRPSNTKLLWRIGNFDHKASQYAAWFLKDHKPKAHVISYILMREQLPEAIPPESALFQKGGAFFHQTAGQSEAFSTHLYNITENDEWHTNRETNGIGLSAYGSNMLVNGGWLGPATEPAKLQNTLTINGKNHSRKVGHGLTGGLLANGFSFASGNSGNALENGSFERSLLFIQPSEVMPGYIAVIDDVDASHQDTIQTYWHPATETRLSAVKENELYTAQIDHYNLTEDNELSLFFATKPESIQIKKVPSGDKRRTPDIGYHHSVQANYADAKRIITLLQPSNPSNPRAKTKRVSGQGDEATQLIGSKAIDTLYSTTTDIEHEYGSVRFQAENLWYRTLDEEVVACFLQKGTSFESKNLKISTEHPSNLYFDRKTLWIESTGTTVYLRSRDKEITEQIEPGRQRIDIN